MRDRPKHEREKIAKHERESYALGGGRAKHEREGSQHEREVSIRES